MQTFLIILAIVLGAIVLLNIFARAKMKNAPKVTDHENILVLTEQNFDQQTKNKIVLVDFWAAWCAPCRIMAPILNEVAAELPEGYRVGKVILRNINQWLNALMFVIFLRLFFSKMEKN